MTFRAAVIGTGAIGFHHARILSGLPGVELVGVADQNPELAASVAGRYGCPAFGSLDALLAERPDGVVVAVPNQAHAQVALSCIERGVAVLVEKPIATSVADAEAIINAAEARGVTLMVGHVERFNPVVQVLKDCIAGESLISISITRVGPFPPRMSDVGVIIDLGVHDIDLVRYISGSEMTDGHALLTRTVARREDTALMQFRTASGVLAQINTNWITPFKSRKIELITDRKYLSGDLITRQIQEYSKFEPRDGSYVTRHVPVPSGEPLALELAHFVECARTGARPVASGQDGLEALRIAIRALEEGMG